uniref:DUF4614 domain-containing protein n=1 Tax=Timema poppense TaxID=170557 RepID=A0A7R9H468_TIMPO|nr:unnamed protein product [Timema poppensis]
MSGINSSCRVFLWLNATQHTRQMERFHWRIGFVQSALHTLRKRNTHINDHNVAFNVKTFEDLIAHQEDELVGDHPTGSPTLDLEYDDDVDNENISFTVGTSDKERRTITTDTSVEISSSNNTDDETEGMLRTSNSHRNTNTSLLTLSSVDVSSIPEEVSVILQDNGDVGDADSYSDTFQSDEQNVSHQDVGVQTNDDCLPPGLLEDRRPILGGLLINQMLRQQLQLTRHVIASQCVVGLVINQMLRQQLQLTRHVIASQRAMYKSYTTSVKSMRDRYQPVTLNDTKKRNDSVTETPREQ